MPQMILHMYRDGNEFSVDPSDIKRIEVNEGRTVVFHILHVQVPPTPIETPRGRQLLPSHIETMLNAVEVIESIDSIQMMESELAAGACARDAEATTKAAAIRNTNFGSGPREEVKVYHGEEN